MSRLIIATLLLLALNQSAAWTINADFENGSVGSKAQGSNAFSGAFKLSLFSNETIHTGNRSAVLGIDEGSTGWGNWGGSFKYPSTLREGDELWVRVWAYFPSEFSFNCGGCTQGVKFIRIGTESEKGGEGFHSILLKDGAVDIDSEVTGKLFHDNNSGRKTVGEKNARGRWHSYEMYIKFSSAQGKGVYRVWQNGNLIFEDTATNTLKTPTSTSHFIYLFTYWNSGAPKTQHMFIDDVVITNETPGDTDTHGNPFIGLGGYKFVAPPSPPTLN